MMHGKVWVESPSTNFLQSGSTLFPTGPHKTGESGKGSTFHFTARLNLEPTLETEMNEPRPVVCPPIHRRFRVLVVEDDEANCLLAIQILQNGGHESEHASSGQAALDALSRADFDLVLMDIKMPGMDGLEATRRIRNPKSMVRNRRIPIIALTAHAMKEDEVRCIQAGMNACIAKPFESSALLATMDRVMS